MKDINKDMEEFIRQMKLNCKVSDFEKKYPNLYKGFVEDWNHHNRRRAKDESGNYEVLKDGKYHTTFTNLSKAEEYVKSKSKGTHHTFSLKKVKANIQSSSAYDVEHPQRTPDEKIDEVSKLTEKELKFVESQGYFPGNYFGLAAASDKVLSKLMENYMFVVAKEMIKKDKNLSTYVPEWSDDLQSLFFRDVTRLFKKTILTNPTMYNIFVKVLKKHGSFGKQLSGLSMKKKLLDQNDNKDEEVNSIIRKVVKEMSVEDEKTNLESLKKESFFNNLQVKLKSKFKIPFINETSVELKKKFKSEHKEGYLVKADIDHTKNLGKPTESTNQERAIGVLKASQSERKRNSEKFKYFADKYTTAMKMLEGIYKEIDKSLEYAMVEDKFVDLLNDMKENYDKTVVPLMKRMQEGAKYEDIQPEPEHIAKVAKEVTAEQKYDEKFIKGVAKSILGKEIDSADCKRAHNAAKRYNDPQDYYDALKEFFGN